MLDLNCYIHGKGFIMFSKTHALLVGAGFLAGTLGLKAVTSDAAKRLAVQGVAAGMRVKAGYEDVVEQAKAQVDDIVAEAAYLNSAEGDACACGCKADATEPAAAKAE